MTNELTTITKALENNDGYMAYGIRADRVKYDIGDTPCNSHQLYQDPQWDDDGELLYEANEDGLYDAGELDGTCAVMISDQYDSESVREALETVLDVYQHGDIKYVHVLASDRAYEGNDIDEIVMENARVICTIEF